VRALDVLRAPRWSDGLVLARHFGRPGDVDRGAGAE
jgi:hypothetical protein